MFNKYYQDELTYLRELGREFAAAYPALFAHMKAFESFVPPGGKAPAGLRHRQDHGRYWWELRPCAYYELFERTKILYQEIQYYPSYTFEQDGMYTNNKVFLLPSSDLALLSVMNSPLMWWHNWRSLPHMKDEALSPMGVLVEALPIALPQSDTAALVERLVEIASSRRGTTAAVADWLRHEFGIERAGQLLEAPERLDADAFIAAVRKARHGHLTAAEIGRLKREHEETVEPARLAAAEAAALERRISDHVNAAYGLTPEDVALMWRTAPPRMPGAPKTG